MNKYVIYNLVRGEWIAKLIMSFNGRKGLIKKLKKENSELLSVLGTWKVRKL